MHLPREHRKPLGVEMKTARSYWCRTSQLGALAVSMAVSAYLVTRMAVTSPAPIVVTVPSEPGVIVAPVEARASPDTEAIHPEPPQFRWEMLAAHGIADYARRLREIGCPEHVVLGVMAEELRSRYWGEMRQLRRESMADYWEHSSGVKSARSRARSTVERAAEERLRTIHAEYETWRRNLGLPDERDERDRFPEDDNDDIRLSFLADDKRDRVREQEEAVTRLRRRLKAQELDDSVIQQQLLELQAAHDLERREFLAPDEYAELKLRESPHARLIGDLAGFEPTREEREAIIQWRESSGVDLTTEQWGSGLRSLLGDERFSLFQRGLDPGYRELVEMTQYLQMDDAVAGQVYEAERSAKAAVAAIRSGEGIGSEAELESLAAIQRATEQTLLEYLGQSHYEVYLRRADWLRLLAEPRGAP